MASDQAASPDAGTDEHALTGFVNQLGFTPDNSALWDGDTDCMWQALGCDDDKPLDAFSDTDTDSAADSSATKTPEPNDADLLINDSLSEEVDIASLPARAAAAAQAGKPKRRKVADPQRERERNRVHAKRSRLRKKFMMQNLEVKMGKQEKQIAMLLKHMPRDAMPAMLEEMRENNLLDDEDDGLINMSKKPMGTISEAVIKRSDALAPPAAPATSGTVIDTSDFLLVQALQGAQQNFVITNPRLRDNPIVYASQGFCRLTGYMLTDIVGKNCRFLQGPETDPRAPRKIRDAITQGVDCQVAILNYRKDRSIFYQHFFIAPLRGKDGFGVENFIGVQCEITKEQYDILQKTQFAEAESTKTQNQGSLLAGAPGAATKYMEPRHEITA